MSYCDAADMFEIHWGRDDNPNAKRRFQAWFKDLKGNHIQGEKDAVGQLDGRCIKVIPYKEILIARYKGGKLHGDCM